jgi:SAM-dependent methyltransferase
MNLEAVWHDLECGDYTVDLPLWRVLANQAGGAVLEVGAGTGRVSLDLAAHGVPVVALDNRPALLYALRARAGRLPVRAVAGDARELSLGERFSLIVVPMQTLQLLGGSHGRSRFLRHAFAHLHPGGVLAAALADALHCFDEQHPAPPPPQVWEILGVRHSSSLLSVQAHNGAAMLRRRREITGPDGLRSATDVIVSLDRVTPEQAEGEARACGFTVAPRVRVMQTERYLSSTVVIVRAPGGASAPESTISAGSNAPTGS